MFLDRGKKSGHPEEIHTGTGRTYYFHQFNSEMTATPLEMPNITVIFPHSWKDSGKKMNSAILTVSLI